MPAPALPLIALGTAFAAGVAVTVAVVGVTADRPAVQHGARGEAKDPATGPARAGAAGASRPAAADVQASSADKWVDPVRPQPPVASARTALPPLVFDPDDRAERAGDGAAGPDEGRASAPPSVVARVSPPRRPSIAELSARPDGAAAPVTAHDATDRAPPPRPPGDALAREADASRSAAAPRRRTAIVRPAAGGEDRPVPAAERAVRRVYVARRVRDDGAQQEASSGAVRRAASARTGPERGAAEPRQRVTSAEGGGVMRWLGLP